MQKGKAASGVFLYWRSIASLDKGLHGFDGQKTAHAASKPLTIQQVFSAGFSLPGRISAPAKLQAPDGDEFLRDFWFLRCRWADAHQSEKAQKRLKDTLSGVYALVKRCLEDITTDDVQRLFNGMSGTKATKDKVRMVLNQILNTAVEDKLISQNPVKSHRVKITGKASKATLPYSVEQMRFLVQHIGDIQSPDDRAFLALIALHPLRLEEVLGLRAEDVDTKEMAIHVCRAVTHPTLNQPEIKETKTDASARTLGLSALALPHLCNRSGSGFLLGGDKPLSYTQVKKMCLRIKRDTGFSENITPIRFRTTVLTDLYDQTKDIKLAQTVAGHTTSAMTLKYYVKGRETSSQATAAVERAYSA